MTTTGPAVDTTVEIDGIALFQKKNYRIKVTMWIRVNTMTLVAAILNTVAGPNLTNKR